MKKAQPEIIKTIELLKGIKRNLERGKDYDDFILDTNIQKKFSEVFTGTSFSIKQVIAIIRMLQKEVKRLWRARKDLEKMLDSKVMLRLWVKVKKDWTNDQGAMNSMGYKIV